MKYIVFSFGVLLLLSSCFFSKPSTEIKKIKYRIINNTSLNFTNVSIFSNQIGTIKAYDTIGYAVTNYDSLKHDPLFYGIYDEVNYARYLLLPKTNNERVTYSIDSIANKIIYISTK
ncbi:hypothetical protein [Cellulophaga sp. L1A9]|uniref:hypothetical protein n=1 Tax=Cellulophaga sp. L1A9 TaxID=2686362 RepID=UPI00131C94FD|nr:hypothetical protein [Cellulophaga sp. L1A9]